MRRVRVRDLFSDLSLVKSLHQVSRGEDGGGAGRLRMELRLDWGSDGGVVRRRRGEVDGV